MKIEDAQVVIDESNNDTTITRDWERLMIAMPLIAKYNDGKCELACEHDKLYVGGFTEDISREDLAKLGSLSIGIDEETESFYMFV